MKLFLLLTNMMQLVLFTNGFFLLDKEKVIGDTRENCIETRRPFSRTICDTLSPFSNLDGTCNNLQRPIQGSALTRVARFIPSAYARDGDTPVGFPFFSVFEKIKNDKTTGIPLLFGNALFTKSVSPSPQEISDNVFQVINRDFVNPARAAHIFMTFGQFIDHDMVIIEGEPEKCVKKPRCQTLDDFKFPCNPILRSTKTNRGCNFFARSSAACDVNKGPRDQVNQLTSFIDGSMIYGSNLEQLKRVIGLNGKLRTSRGDLLPFDPENERPCREIKGCFLAGDIRVNENIALTSMHTVFLRLHNIYATKLKQVNPRWSSNTIFQETRKIIIGILQNILYSEWLPLATDLSPYRGYNPNVDASINNGFATAAYRFGHSLVRNNFDQLDRGFNVARNQVPLQNAFNNIAPLLQNGIEETMFGLLVNDSKRVDIRFSEGIAKRLFIPPGSKGFQNLAAINIQRGRDHGLPSYTEYRKFCNIGPNIVRSFDDFSGQINRRQRDNLQRIFGSVNLHIDLYPGAIAERPVRGKLVGPTFGCLIKKQFENLRDGDRFFFERNFKFNQLCEIKKMTLAKVLCLTLNQIVSIQDNVFERFIPGETRRKSCQNADLLDITKFKQ